MSPPGRPKGEYRSAQREGSPVSAAGEAHPHPRPFSREREKGARRSPRTEGERGGGGRGRRCVTAATAVTEEVAS